MFLKPKRKIDKVYLHCSASNVKSHDDISVIEKWHKERGFKECGYHYFIKKNGQLQFGRNLEKIPASQKGHNRYSISICVSGIKNFSNESLATLKLLCKHINKEYDNITFHGHCEVSNKTCPVFDYKTLLNLNEEGKIMTVKRTYPKESTKSKKRNLIVAIIGIVLVGTRLTQSSIYAVSNWCEKTFPNNEFIRKAIQLITLLIVIGLTSYVGYIVYTFFKTGIIAFPYFN